MLYSYVHRTSDLRNKTSEPVFYRRMKYKYEFGAYELNQNGASPSDSITRTRMSTYILFTRMSTYILFCDKTQVQMFYFDSKTARLIVLMKCGALVF